MMRVIACTCSCLAFFVSALNNHNPHIIQRPTTIATTVARRPTTLLQGRSPGENKENEVSTSADDSRKNSIAVDLKKIRDEVRELQQSSPLMLARPLATTTAEESSSLLDVIPTTNNDDKFVAAINVAILGAATFGMATVWNNLLVDFEWMQAWRYTWPCVGFLFIYEGYRGLADEFGLVGGSSPTPSSSSSSFISKIASAGSTADNQRDHDDISLAQLASDTISLQADRPVWLRTIAILAGASLVIGGAADALLPVYVTGPNLFTRAGLAPDAAAFLASYQAFVLMGRVWPSGGSSSSSSSTNNNINLTICAAHVLLLSQLLILGAGSFEDAVTLISENVSAAV